MKTLLMLALLTSALSAAPMNPDFTIDGVTLDSGAPGKGAKMYAIPGTTWDLFYEDGWDGDYNDFWVRVDFEYTVPEHLSFRAEYMGNLSAYTNTIFVYGSGVLSGSPVSFFLAPEYVGGEMPFVSAASHVNFPSWLWASYPMGSDRLMVRCVSCPEEVPEPATYLMIGGGLIAAWGIRRRRQYR